MLSLRSPAVKLMVTMKSQVNEKLMSELSNTDYLQRLNQDFLLMLDSSNIEVYSMYETIPTPIIGIVVSKDSVFLGHSRERLFGIASRSQNLAKFETNQDQGYVIINLAINRAIERYTQQNPPPPTAQLASQVSRTSDINASNSEGLGRSETLPAREASRAAPTRTGSGPERIRRVPTARFVFDALADSDSVETGT